MQRTLKGECEYSACTAFGAQTMHISYVPLK